MMITAIVLIAVAFYFFSASFRGFLESIFYGMANFWEDHRALFIWTVVALWFVHTIALLATGWYANSTTSAIIFMILFPIWILLSVGRGLRRIRAVVPGTGTVLVSRSSSGFLRCLISIILIIAVFNICLGLFSQDNKESLDRFRWNGWKSIFSWMDDVSTWREGKTGEMGMVNSDNVFGYSKDGLSFYHIPKGRHVRLVTEYKGGKVSKASEGMIWVMVENKNGDFVRGDLYLVPRRKIIWGFQEDNTTKTGTQIEKSESGANQETLPNEKGKSRSVQTGKDSWAVRYRLGDDWFGPVVPRGKYVLTVVKDKVLEGMIGERRIEVNKGRQEVDVFENFSPIRFRAPEGGGETVLVKISRIGNPDAT
ncbi:MAG: hypothetical protein WC906_03275 [Parcubacteria group bacterium]|jgi:hypothetical protein